MKKIVIVLAAIFAFSSIAFAAEDMTTEAPAHEMHEGHAKHMHKGKKHEHKKHKEHKSMGMDKDMGTQEGGMKEKAE